MPRPGRSTLLALVAVTIAATATPLLLLHTGGAALHNGDEAIYAEMGREMAASGRIGELTWQGEVLFPRPPGAIWPLAIGHAVCHDERAVRWPLALACGAELALVFLLGCVLGSPAQGVAAAGVLFTADLFLGYARYFESEPFLCVWVLAAFFCYELARGRPKMIYAYGVCLAGALLTKQLVGALPLLAPLVDVVATDRRRPAHVGRALGVAALVALPWHLYALFTHGREFLDAFLLQSVVKRSSGGMLRTTRATFYLRELWRSDRPLLFAAVVGALLLLPEVVRRRGRALLLLGWALGVLVVYSAARSRYDYYLLLAYPALVLIAAQACQARLPRPLPGLVAAALVALQGLWHLPRNLGGFVGDEEVRTLVTAAERRSLPLKHLYAYNVHAYSARYYATVDVTMLLESNEDVRLAGELRKSGMPAPTLAAGDLGATLGSLAPPFALIFPAARAELLGNASAGLRQVGRTAHYLLLHTP
jgi:4-amino-4-deoxy-L-arabinose transferase-like glycosyltransferase